MNSDRKVVPGNEWLTVDRYGNIWKTKTGKKLKPTLTQKGYLKVSTWVNNLRVYCLVHRAVALAFIPNPNNLPTVNHIDADKTNNFFDNLEWATQKEQLKHAHSLGLQTLFYGEDNPNSKYTSDTIYKVCKLIEDGYRYCDIARKCNVDKSLPANIKHSKIWKHISSEYDFTLFRSKKLSEETIKWVCQKLSENFNIDDIFEIANNKNISKEIITGIKNRSCYTSTSKHYDF